MYINKELHLVNSCRTFNLNFVGLYKCCIYVSVIFYLQSTKVDVYSIFQYYFAELTLSECLSRHLALRLSATGEQGSEASRYNKIFHDVTLKEN